jgi:UDP-N-acetylglucosamine 2-epimerase
LKKAILVVGTRPQIVKSVPVIHEAAKAGTELEIVHTRQHYDYNMSDIFFEGFYLARPLIHLGVGSGTQGHQIAEILLRLERFLSKDPPDLVLVPGDTNSALASAITRLAKKETNCLFYECF